jgi:hypothetical protein
MRPATAPRRAVIAKAENVEAKKVPAAVLAKDGIKRDPKTGLPVDILSDIHLAQANAEFTLAELRMTIEKENLEAKARMPKISAQSVDEASE